MEPQILLYVLKDKNSVNYERLKKNMDCRFGIVSQSMLFHTRIHELFSYLLRNSDAECPC